jgi:hypothetical protein
MSETTTSKAGVLGILNCGSPGFPGWYTEQPAPEGELRLVGPFPGQREATAFAWLRYPSRPRLDDLVHAYSAEDIDHLVKNFADLGLKQVKLVTATTSLLPTTLLKQWGVPRLTVSFVREALEAVALAPVAAPEPAAPEPVAAPEALSVAEPVVEPLPVQEPVAEEPPAPTIEAAEPVELATAEPVEQPLPEPVEQATTDEAPKPDRNRIDPAVKAEALRLVAEGVSVRQIARQLDVGQTTVRGWVKKLASADGNGDDAA